MDDVDALLDALGRSAEPEAAAAVEELVRRGDDADLARVNALALAAGRGLDEDAVIAALLHAARLGLFEMTWNILCPSCGGVLDANATLKSVRQEAYHCAFCALETEPTLDDTVEVTFALSPRVRRIASHDPEGLDFWDYHRDVFFGSGVRLPEGEAREALAREALLESVALGPGERIILALRLDARPVIVFDPVTHTAHAIEVAGEPTNDRQELAVVLDAGQASGQAAGQPKVGRSTLRPGPLRLSLENRAGGRALPGVFAAGDALQTLLGGRRPFLTAKRLLSNQTFRDLYRTDTLDVDQRLKITSLTFLFSDLRGSTALYQRVGDLVAYDLVRAHFRLITAIVASESGAIVKTIGDAVMATFPTPARAVSAALRMRAAMGRLNEERGAADLQLKIGLHEGACLAVHLNDRQDYFGQTVNIASRVQALAAPDGVLATEPVVRHAAAAEILAAAGIAPRPREAHLRGVGESIPLFELTWQVAAATG